MPLIDRLTVRKIEDEATRDGALEVLHTVYQGEKDWVNDLDAFFPKADLENPNVAWFLASIDDEPIGVTRVLYEIPFELYKAYGFELTEGGIDVEAFVRNNRIAEVGRFAVVPKHRKKVLVAAILMRAAATETVERGFTHFITDVFETDPNSPYKFHQRILGFRTVATHNIGELKHMGRRITMLLDLRDAFHTMRKRNGWIFRYITQGWSDRLVGQLT